MKYDDAGAYTHYWYIDEGELIDVGGYPSTGIATITPSTLTSTSKSFTITGVSTIRTCYGVLELKV